MRMLTLTPNTVSTRQAAGWMDGNFCKQRNYFGLKDMYVSRFDLNGSIVVDYYKISTFTLTFNHY